MLRYLKMLLVLAPVFSYSAIAREMPCFITKAQLLDAGNHLSNPGLILRCLEKHRVCIQTVDAKVLEAEAIRDIPMEGSAEFGIVQTAPGDEPAFCLAGIYSGGSAAAWMFRGWLLKNGSISELDAMDKAVMNSDAVPPKTLGNAIYQAYKKYAQ